MTREEFGTKVEELLKDKAFCEKLGTCSDYEEAAGLFKQEGIEIEADDVAQLAKALSESGELDETQLETVTGGGLITGLLGVLAFTWETLPGGKYHDRLQGVVDYWYRKGYYNGWWH